ncbi:sugar-binding transcriptional regulator [Streptomyces sp. YIM S03343]
MQSEIGEQGWRESGAEADRQRVALLLKVARMYYEANATQAEIAKELGWSRPTVSRMLRECRELGIVRIEVGHVLERAGYLEERLMEKFSLSAVRVVGARSSAALMEQTGRVAASYLSSVLRDDMVIGVSNGRSLAALVSQMPHSRHFGTCVAQIIGSLGPDNPMIDGPTICRRLANAIGGTYRALPAPLIVGDASTCAALQRERVISATLTMGTAADIAVVGIGTTASPDSGHIFEGWISDEDARRIRKSGAVGHLCAQFYDAAGQIVPTEFSDRTIGIGAAALRNIPLVIAVAPGRERARAILGALRGGYLDVLVTDEHTAGAVLDLA